MKKLIVIGIVVAMVMGMAVSAMAIDNDWLVSFRVSTESAGKTGASSAVFGVKSAAGDTISKFTGIANLASSPEINYYDATHPYPTDYGVIGNRYYVAKFGGAPITGSNTIDWVFRAAGAAGSTIYVNGWNYTGAASTLDADPGFSLKLYEATADGVKVGAAVWEFRPGVVSAWSSNGLSGTANVDFFQKQYTLGSADSAGGAYKYFVLEAAPIPEPGSMVALFSGLVGLVGFGIRRRK